MQSDVLIISEFFMEIEVGLSKEKCAFPLVCVLIAKDFLAGEDFRLDFADFLVVEFSLTEAFFGEPFPGESNSVVLTELRANVCVVFKI